MISKKCDNMKVMIKKFGFFFSCIPKINMLHQKLYFLWQNCNIFTPNEKTWSQKFGPKMMRFGPKSQSQWRSLSVSLINHLVQHSLSLYLFSPGQLQDKYGRTTLSYVAEKGKSLIVDVLISKCDADPTIEDCKGKNDYFCLWGVRSVSMLIVDQQTQQITESWWYRIVHKK